MTFATADLKWGDPTLGTESGTIYWSADLSDGLVYDGSLYGTADFEAALQEAFDTWEMVASVDFERAADPADADLTIDMAPLAGSTVGVAYYSYFVLPGTDQIIDASIDMDSLESWAPFGETDLNWYAVALHEIGHTLGLEHVNDTTEIMNPVISTDRLGDGDIAGVRELYGFDATDTDMPPPPAPDAPYVPDGGGAPDPGGPGPHGLPRADGDDDDGSSIFDLLFGWIFAIFGGDDDDDTDSTTVPVADSDGHDIIELIPATDDTPALYFATTEGVSAPEDDADIEAFV